MSKQHNAYPWNVWFKRRVFRLVKGDHFNCAPHSMSVQVRGAARKRGIRVSVFIEGSVLIVTRTN